MALPLLALVSSRVTTGFQSVITSSPPVRYHLLTLRMRKNLEETEYLVEILFLQLDEILSYRSLCYLILFLWAYISRNNHERCRVLPPGWHRLTWHIPRDRAQGNSVASAASLLLLLWSISLPSLAMY